jgi:putative ABC transport system permease protein
MTAPAKARAAIFGRAVPGRLAAGVATSNQVGDRVSLSIGGQFATWVVVGVVEEVGSPAAAYVTRETYAQAVGEGGRAQMLRIASSAVDPEARLEAIRKIEAALARAGIGVRVGLPLAELRTAMGDHVVVLQRTLVATAGLLGVIGLLGLTSNLTMNVIERTRELGVMKAVGARPRTLLWLIVIEGQWIALLSCVWAVPVAAGLSWLLGRIVGAMAFGLPLPLAFSPWVAVLWVVALCGLALLAGALPARRAARITVREALAYG